MEELIMKTLKLNSLSRLTVAVLVLAVALADTATSHAQRSRRGRGGDSLLDMARDGDVRTELKLTDEQADLISKIRDSFRSAREKVREFEQRIQEAKDDTARAGIEAQRQAFIDTQLKAAEAELAKVVSAEQLRGLRLHQLKRRGMRGIGAEWVVAELKLTDDQKTKLKVTLAAHDQQKRALDEARMAVFRNRELPREERETKFKALETQREQLGDQRDQAVLGLLTATQKTSFQTLAGTPAAAGTPEPQKPVAAVKPAATVTPSATPTPAATPAADRGAKVVGADGKPVATEVVASFGATAAASGSQPAKSLKFNFVQAPWSDVLKMFSDAAGLTWDRETVPPGTFTYFDDKDYTPTEALNVLNGALLQKGFILLRRDRFAVVVNVDDTVPPNLVPTVAIADLPQRASNELVRVVMPLEGKDAAKAATEVADLLGPQGKATALSVANSLVVTGLANNVAEIYAVLKSYIPEEEKDLTYEAFVLQNVSALSAEKMIRDLFGLQARGVQNVSAAASGGGSSSRGSSRGRGGSDARSRFASMFGGSRGGSRESSRDPRRQQSGRGGASAGGSVSVTVDERTNMLLAMAPPTQMEVIRKAIETIDVPSGDTPNRFAEQDEDSEPYLEVYKVTSADTMEVTKTLDVLFPGAVINEDGRFRTIHVMSNKRGHEEIQRMIRKLDGQGGGQTTTAIIPIRQDPATLTATLQGLYGKDIENAPSVIANPGYLVVRGSPEQIAEIQQMVTQLESAIGVSLATGGGPIRTIPLGGRDADSLLRLLQSVTPNPIRISIPSSQRGPIRDERVPSADDPRVRPETGATGGGAGGAAAAADRRAANFSVPPLRQAGNGAGNGAGNTQDSGEVPAATPAVDESQRHRRLATFVFKNLDSDKDGKLSEAEWSASKRTRELFEARKVSLKLPADQAAFLKAFVQLAPSQEEDSGKNDAQPAERAAPAAATARPPLRPADEGAAGGDDQLPEIVIEIRDGNLILISDDEAALDKLEARLQSLMAHMPVKTTWTIFYLRSADATEAALMLERLFPQSSVSASASSSGGSLFGDLTGGLSSMGSSLMDMTGINSLSNGPMALRIIPETRANALFVSGPADQVADVESVLKILDAAELPEQLRTRAPRYITVEHADVNEVAQIVRDVYKEELTSSRRSGGNSAQGASNPFAMLMGGGGGSRGRSSRGGGGGGSGGVKMTLGVDTRTSALVISASDSLFRQVEALVTTLDKAALEARRTVRIVTLQNTNSSAIQQAVQALLPKTTVSTGGGGSSGPTGFGPSSRGGSSRGGSAAGGDQAARMRQFMEMRQRTQGRGGSTGGRTSRGSSGRSPFGGRTGGSSRGGSSGRSPFGGRGSSRGR